MIPDAWLRGEIAVLGLGKSGTSVSRLLARHGAAVYASDLGSGDDVMRNAAELRNIGVDAIAGAHDLNRIAGASLVVVSPGVPPDAPPLLHARSSGREVVSEIEVALRFLDGTRYIAVTGTNGKTTTTALIGHLLRALGYQAVDAGNIGTPLSELALMEVKPAWVALEMSSFQLHDTPSIKPAVGVLTNLSPDHLDRYADADEYYSDKMRLFSNADSTSIWVLNNDDEISRAKVGTMAGARLAFSLKSRAVEAFLDASGSELVVMGLPVLHRDEFRLLGEHNVANALAAALAVMAADPAHSSTEMRSRMRDGLRTFRPMSHRLESVIEKDGVLWINDSKATNVSSALVAVRSMTRPTILLLGGKHKGESYLTLASDIAKGCKLVICYGASADLIHGELSGHVPVRKLGSSFEEVVAVARSEAAPGDVVLLSPACSSFDMFRNYEERGARFRELATTG